VPENISIRTKRYPALTKIYWKELNGVNIMEFFLHILSRLPVKDVYVSIDKDCLNNEYALTNWEEGAMSLDDLLVMLKLIKEKTNIVGVDITGDYSDISIKSIIKRLASHIDHPKHIKAQALTESVITSVNEETNLKILEILNP
jgi:arginase family enzyme